MTHVGQLSRRTSDTSREAPEVLLARGHGGLARSALTQSLPLLAGPSARPHSYPADTQTLVPSGYSDELRSSAPCGRPPPCGSLPRFARLALTGSHTLSRPLVCRVSDPWSSLVFPRIAICLPHGKRCRWATTITNAGTRDRHPKVTRSCCGSFLRTAPRSLRTEVPASSHPPHGTAACLVHRLPRWEAEHTPRVHGRRSASCPAGCNCVRVRSGHFPPPSHSVPRAG